jgi:hypothetical protein
LLGVACLNDRENAILVVDGVPDAAIISAVPAAFIIAANSNH